jgi:hypothetical protein
VFSRLHVCEKLRIHRAVSEKLQHMKLWKFAVFHTSCGTSSLPSMNKITDGRVFSLVHLTWNIMKQEEGVIGKCLNINKVCLHKNISQFWANWLHILGPDGYIWKRYLVRGFFSPLLALQPRAGYGLLVHGVSWSHNDVPQSVGLLRTSDHPVPQSSTWLHTTHIADKYPFPRWDSNQRPQWASGHRPTP